MLQPVHLRAFQQVLLCGSFAAAGARLGFTASAVSQQIAALERATGLLLFERGPRSIRPTAAAHALAIRVGVVLGQLDALDREVRAMAEGEHGVVRIGSFPTASAGLLPAVLARVSGTRGLRVLLDEAEPDELVERLTAGTLDIALGYEYDAVPTLWSRQLLRTPLLRESLVLLSARGDATLADGGPRELAELAEETWVGSLEGTAGARSLARLCAGAGFDPRVAYRSNDYEVVRGLVRAGLGIAVVPALAHREDPQITATELRVADAGRHVVALQRVGQRTPALDTVLSALVRAARARARDDRFIRFRSARAT